MLRRLLLTLAIPLFLASAWPTRASMVDDAYVSLRYARNLALGHGLVYNAGEPPVEGYTNFLWVVWMAPGTGLPIHPSVWATGWGLVFGALGVWAIGGLCGALIGRTSPWSALPAWVLAALPAYGIACTNGLETAQYVSLLLCASWACLCRPRLGAVLAGLLYLVRPEGVLVGAALVGLLVLRARTWREAFVCVGLASAVVVPYFAVRSWYFGTLGPNTYAAQARHPFIEMFDMNASYYRRSARVYLGALGMFALACLRPSRERMVLLALAVALTLVAMRVYNWMPGSRLFLAPIALIVAVFGASLSELRPRGLFGGAVIIGLAYLSLGPSRGSEATYDRRNSAQPGNEAEELGRTIARVVPAGSWVLSRDAGVVPYFAGAAVKVIDIHPFSLTDPVLTGQAFDLDHVLAGDPAAIVTTAMTTDALPTSYPEERRLLGDRRVKDRYVVVATAQQHHRRYFRLHLREDLVEAR